MNKELITNGTAIAKRLVEVITDQATNPLALPDLCAAYEATVKRLMLLETRTADEE